MTGRGLREFRVEVTEAEHSFVFPLDGRPRFVSIDPREPRAEDARLRAR